MKRRFFLLLLICSVQLSTMVVHAQVTYNMSNLTVDDCEGILLDSENGDIEGTYDHNENYTFSICIPGNGDIIMDFLSFCTEEDFDFLSIYDGPNISSNQIGEDYHGEVDPPQIVATSGCLTLHFTSDPNVTCTGWEAHWYVRIVDPIPPDILAIPNLPCESDALSIQFDPAIPCDSVYNDAFRIVGPQSPGIASVQANPCIGGTTSEVLLNFNNPITASGNYRVIYTTYEINECGALDTLISIEPFAVVDCPLFLSLANDEVACAGECMRLRAEVTGGLAGSYSYQWQPELPNSRTVEVCPNESTIYALTVTDANGSSVVDSIRITPLPLPEITTGNLSICQSTDPFELMAIPTGGSWSGNGIDPAAPIPGWYDPSLSTTLNDTINYTAPNGCMDQIIIDLLPLDPGHEDAACPASAPFYVSGGLPEGGSWTGPHIDPDGLFHPDVIGSFEVTYTHPNGCSGSKLVNVDHITMPNIDSLCQSAMAFELGGSPFGGVWAGPGIVDSLQGLFDPGLVDAGELSLLYRINGCVDSMQIFIKAITAGANLSACPLQAPFILPGNWGPPEGIWAGTGIIDSLSGQYDPSILGDGKNDTLSFHVNGCIDQRVVFIRTTDIGFNDTLFLCTNEGLFNLGDDLLDLIPEGGQWSGNGVINPAEEWQFNPLLAGVGLHQLIYERNECIDSLWVKVSPSPNIEALSICVKEAPVLLVSSPVSGLWSGPGIVNEIDGLFDPQVAGVGLHTIYNETKDACQDEVEIEVYADDMASIIGLEDFYCYKDSNLLVTLQPTGGILSANETVINQINPAQLGPGLHNIKYAVGEGACYSEMTLPIEVGFPLEVTLPFDLDSLCFGEQVSLSAEASGGDSLSNYTYHWDQGLGFGKHQLVRPEQPTTYTVGVNDGCSETAYASIDIFVHPKINIFYQTGPRVCFEDTTFAIVQASPAAPYQYLWDTEPPLFSDTLFSYPTTYQVHATNTENGCENERAVELPGYDAVKANFIISPNQSCISSLNPEIEIIDFSVGARGGYWDFGDSSVVLPYVFGEPVRHVYADTGSYTVRLHLENDGFCVSEHEVPLCVEAEHRLFAPNAFTPNYDGKNDFFAFKGVDIEQIDWQVFNRWGQQVFVGRGMEDHWDGTYKGQRVSPGVYTYVARFQARFGKREIMKGLVTVVY